jgi:predicted metal-dependent phosphoesterase TrpH
LESSPGAAIDLHVHTTASDGTVPPAEVISLAVETDLAAIAITDHDTVAGVREALQGGIPRTLAFVTGVEISAAPPAGFPFPGSFHILGYGIDIDDDGLNRLLRKLQESRQGRNPQIIQRLRSLHIDISLETIMHRFPNEPQLGRPHIATVMKENGVVASIADAFDRYLGNGKPAYVDKYRPPCDEAIAAIHAAGGVAVMAHPGVVPIEPGQGLERLLAHLKTLGLDGIEVYYSQHSDAQTAGYLDAARRYGLLVTGGTDFHGALNPDIQLGIGRGGLTVPFALYEALQAYRPPNTASGAPAADPND